MSRTAQGTVATGLTMVAVAVISMVSVFIIFPMAAWNHNLVLMVIAGLSPMILTRLAVRVNGLKAVPSKNPTSPLQGILVMALSGFLLWHHMVLLFVVFLIVMMVLGSKRRKR